MVVYANNVFTKKIYVSDIRNLSLNIAMLAIVYALMGALVSYVFYYLFDEYDEKWKKSSGLYKLYDVAVEIALMALIAFWAVFTINTSAPIFPVRHQVAEYVDTYTSGMFFMYAIFLFMGSLGDKLKDLYETYLSKHFDRAFPSHGSILDFSLRYSR
jgi:hypothetical protein